MPRRPTQIQDLRGALDDRAVVHARVGGDDHREVDAVQGLVQGDALEVVLGQLGHVRVVVADLGAALAQQLDDLHRFLGDLPERSEELQRDQPIVVFCQTGTRSSIAASLLRARGFEDVTNFPGGVAEWQRSGFAVEAGEVSADSH